MLFADGWRAAKYFAVFNAIIFAVTLAHPSCYRRRMQNHELVVVVHRFPKVKTSPRVVIQSCNSELCQMAFLTENEGRITVITNSTITRRTHSNKREQEFFAILDLMFVHCRWIHIQLKTMVIQTRLKEPENISRDFAPWRLTEVCIRFRGAYCLPIALSMKTVSTSEILVIF